MRAIHSPQASFKNLKGPVPVNKGGTGASSALQAAASLGAVSKSLLGAPNGIAQADSNNEIPSSGVPSQLTGNATISGNKTVVINSANTYQITNYNVFATYTLEAINGSISRAGDTITYTAPGDAGAGGFSVNGKVYQLTVVAPYINQPSIVSPTNGSTGLTDTVVFTGSDFAVTDDSDIHQSSDWQLATDSAFTAIVASVTADTVNKTAWTASGLSVNTTYYARCRYQGAVYGASAWSAVSSFTTKASFIPATEQAILTASDKVSTDWFGWNVAISENGNTVCVGAIYHDAPSMADTGQAYIFIRSGSTWSQQAILSASDNTGNDQFGFCVSVSSDGNTVCVGAPYHRPGTLSDAGQAYIFVRSGTTWSQQAILLASDKALGDNFGRSVTISSDGNTVCVGAPCHNTGGLTDAGQAYIFVRAGTTWSQQALLSASDKAADDQFGISVSISGDGNTVCIGAIFHNTGGLSDAGQAYIFIRSGTAWSQQAILSASDKAINDYFGQRVAISGDSNTVCISSFYKTVSGVQYAGQAYIFTRSGTAWSQQAILSASDKAADDQFGYSGLSLSSDGNMVCIGSHYHNPSGVIDAGAAYIFTRAGTVWSQRLILTASNKSTDARFGSGAAVSGDSSTICIGAYEQDSGGILGSGAAYIFA